MRNSTSSLASLGLKCQQSRWGLRTGDGVRQETPGARTAGTGGKGPAEKLSNWGGPPKAAQLNLSITNKCTEWGE
jgi:hypothetical protein